MALATIIIASPPSAAASPDGDALLRAGYQQLCQGKNEQAVETLSAAVRANPASVDARRYLGYSLLQIGLATQALVQLEYVNKAQQPSANDITLLGDAYFYNGQYAKALACYKQALAKDNCLESAHAGLVHTYVAMGQPQQAATACQRAIAQSRTIAAHSKLSELLRELEGDPHAQSVVLSE